MIDECHHQVNKLRPLGPAALVGEADEAAGSDEEKSEAVGQKLGAARLLVPEADRKVPQISYFEQTQDQILAPRKSRSRSTGSDSRTARTRSFSTAAC